MSTFFFKQGFRQDRGLLQGLLQRHGFRQEDRGGVDQFSFDFPSDERGRDKPPGCARWVMDPTNKPRTRKASGSYAGPAAKKGYQSKTKKKFRGGPRKARDSDCIRCKSVDGGATNQDRHE